MALNPTVTSLAAAQSIFEKLILPSVTVQYPNQRPFLAMLSYGKNSSGGKVRQKNRNVVRMDNTSFYIPMSNGQAFGTFTPIDNQVSFSQLNLNQAQVSAAYMTISQRYDDVTVAATADRNGAVTPIVQQIINQLRDGMANSLEFHMLSDGTDTYALTTATGSGSQTIAVALDVDRQGTRYLYPGQVIQVAGATGGTTFGSVPSGTRINSVNYANQTITVDDTLSFSPGSAIHPLGPDGSTTQPMASVQTLTNGGTVQGIDTDTTPWTQVHTYSTPGAFSLTQFEQLYVSPITGSPDLGLCNAHVFYEIGNSVQNLERTGMGPTAYLDAGWATITGMGGKVDFVLDHDMPSGFLYLLDSSTFGLGILRDISYPDALPLVRIPTFLTYETVLRWYGNLFIMKWEPNTIWSAIS